MNQTSRVKCPICGRVMHKIGPHTYYDVPTHPVYVCDHEENHPRMWFVFLSDGIAHQVTQRLIWVLVTI